MKIALADFIYAFDNDTYVEVVDHVTGEIIFSGELMEVIRDINRADEEFSIALGRPYNYAEIKGRKLVVYPDIK